jgi:positive regulator of sigma E activity
MRHDGTQKGNTVLTILAQERETLLRKAREGYASFSELFYLLRGRPLSSAISYNEIELVMKRLAINFTEHRFAEILSGAKLLHARQSFGFTKINFANVEEYEFEKLFVYIENSVSKRAKTSLDLSAKSLTNYSVLTFFIYLFTILVVSNLAFFFFQGEYLGSLICFSIPILVIYFVRRRKALKEVPDQKQKVSIEMAFEEVTNSKVEIIV